MLVPLILKAKSNPDYELVVLGLTTAAKVLADNNIEFIGFKNLIDTNNEIALEYGAKLAREMVCNDQVSEQETIAYMGLSFWDLVCKHGYQRAEDLYKKHGRQAFLPNLVMQLLFEKTSPDILISTSSPRAERAAFMVAKSLNIPSVCVVGPLATHELEWVSKPGFATNVCVPTEHVKKLILANGRDSSGLFVTGNPAFDQLYDVQMEHDTEKYKQTMGWEDKRIILWASQLEPNKHPFTGELADPELPRKVDNALIELSGIYPDWQIIVRHHPSEETHELHYPPNIHVSKSSEDLNPLLLAADVIIVMTSTVGLQGALIGKPIVAINMSIFKQDVPYEKMGIAKGVNRLVELEEAIVACLIGNWKQTERLPKIGDATIKIYSIIEDIIQ